jgi:anthranilate 1,2-dioxygenase large subunit
MSSGVLEMQLAKYTPQSKWPAEGLTRVPTWIYSDPELYAAELQQFFYGKTWNYVGLECEVPEPGSYKTSWIGERQVLLTRDADGVVHVVENRCAHRGSPVCWESRGTAKTLTCPYHQWSYDLKGNLLGLPFLRGIKGEGGMPRDFDKSKHGLRKLRVFNRGGAVWASFAMDGPEFESYAGPRIMELYDRIFSGKKLELLGYSRQKIKANWKLYHENLRDPYHATILHSFFVTFGLFRADVRMECDSPSEGRHVVTVTKYSSDTAKAQNEATQQMTNLHDNFALEDADVVRPIDEFGDSLMAHFTLFPSVAMQQHANVFSLRHIIPRGMGEFELSWTQFGYADDTAELREARLKQANLIGPAGYVSLEDGEVVELVYGRLKNETNAALVVEMGGREVSLPTDMMVTESMIRAFYQFYRREMGIAVEEASDVEMA